MWQQARLAQHPRTHCFQILEGRFVSEPMECVSHFREEQLRFVSQTEKRFSTAQAFSCAYDFHDLIRGHRACARLAGIFPESAITTVVAAEIRKRNKHLAGIGDDARLEAIP